MCPGHSVSVDHVGVGREEDAPYVSTAYLKVVSIISCYVRPPTFGVRVYLLGCSSLWILERLSCLDGGVDTCRMDARSS